MNLVVAILIGVGLGVMVELLLPRHTLSEMFLAIFLGIAGSLVARYVGAVAGWVGTEQPETFVASAIGAVIVLILYGALFRRDGRTQH
ncbi:MAG: GlsB/YeaQ/YmgE family stress response membrane protein [Limisphaerales bacterium]